MSTNDTIKIPLSKKGKKYAGKYETVVDSIDADLAQFNWSVLHSGKRPYAWRYIDSKNRPLLHRIIMERILGFPIPNGIEVDHIDNNPLNNTRLNLRLATHAQNQHNQKKPRNSTSGYKGVSKDGNRWRAIIHVNNRQIYLGSFQTPELANEACIAARDQLHGDFARYE